MQIVIEMSKKDYELYKADDWNIPKCLRDALANGTPLSKESDIDNDYMTGYNCGYSDAIYDMSERSEENADSN